MERGDGDDDGRLRRDGDERPALEAFVRQHGLTDRVTFTGQIADPFAWLMRARAAVCASIYEGLCNAIIEALACGTPVVSTNCRYGPREILQGGRYGTLTPVGDAEAMAAAVAAAMTEVPDREFLMARGLDYTPARAADRFLEIIADLEGRQLRRKPAEEMTRERIQTLTVSRRKP